MTIEPIFSSVNLRESWTLQRRGRACAVTGEAFADGEICHTALFLDSQGNWLRQDYSATGWQQRPATGAEPFSHWRSRYEAPGQANAGDEAAPGPLGSRSPEELLRQLCEQDEAHTENLRFVLALMLERARKLREQDAQDLGDHRVLVYENPKSGELFLIRDPKLRLDQLDALQLEITALLSGEGAAAAHAVVEEQTPAPQAQAAEPDQNQPPRDSSASDQRPSPQSPAAQAESTSPEPGSEPAAIDEADSTNERAV